MDCDTSNFVGVEYHLHTPFLEQFVIFPLRGFKPFKRIKKSIKMKCPECHFDNREEAKFCKNCGAKLELACPKCNSGLTVDSIFCDECGYDLF
jgi:hypothetical protein